MRFCVRCGRRFDDAVTRFCVRCGTPRQHAPAAGAGCRVRLGSAVLPVWLLCLAVVLLAGGGLTAALAKPSPEPPDRPVGLSSLRPSPWSSRTRPPFPPPTPTPTYRRTTAAPSPTPTPTPTRNAIESASVGDCFDNGGTEQQVDLTPTRCGDGTFEVLRVLRGTTDRSSCDNVPRESWAVSYNGYRLVLCLSYRYNHGSAYYATNGNCVYGSTGTSDWNEVPCQTGNFTVVGRYFGAPDGSRCAAWPGSDRSETFTVNRWPSLTVQLCLRVNYPDAAGHAVQNECLAMSGPANAMVFRTVRSCGEANVVETGRTSTYNATSFCGNDGWTTWRHNDYPALSYTVCFRRR